MTDARLRSEWLGAMRFDGLSDCAWRVFTCALMWSVEQGTDGLIPTRYLRALHPDGDRPDAYAELVTARLWVSCPDGFQLVDWDGFLGQSTAAQVDAYKENARKRARTYRETQRKKLEGKTTGSTSSKPATDPGTSDVTRDVGEGTGEGEGADSGVQESTWNVTYPPEPDTWTDPDTGEVHQLI